MEQMYSRNCGGSLSTSACSHRSVGIWIVKYSGRDARFGHVVRSSSWHIPLQITVARSFCEICLDLSLKRAYTLD